MGASARRSVCHQPHATFFGTQPLNATSEGIFRSITSPKPSCAMQKDAIMRKIMTWLFSERDYAIWPLKSTQNKLIHPRMRSKLEWIKFHSHKKFENCTCPYLFHPQQNTFASSSEQKSKQLAIRMIQLLNNCVTNQFHNGLPIT